MRRRLRLPILLGPFFAACLGAAALDPAAIAWRPLGQEQGFAGGAVSGIVQDSKGLVWLSCAEGLYRYDGQGFVAFRPESRLDSGGTPAITCVAADAGGGIWIGGAEGLLRCDTLSGEFAWAKLPAATGERASRITVLALDQRGRVLAGTAEGGVWIVDPDSMEGSPFLEPGAEGTAISALCSDAKGRIWVGTEGAGLFLLDDAGRRLAAWSRAGGALPSDRIGAVVEDSLGFVWIGYAEGGIDLFEEGAFRGARVSGRPREPVPLGKSAGRGDGGIPAVAVLAEDVQGQIWAGFRGGGIGVLDPSSMELAVYPFAGGNEVSALLRDRRGLLWAGLRRGGLLTGDFKSASFSRFSASSAGAGLGAISALAELPSGRILAASLSSGLLVQDRLADSFSAAGGGGASLRRIQAILPAKDGSVWLGTAGAGLFRLAPDDSLRRFGWGGPRARGFSSPFVRCLLEADDGGIWVGTEGGGLDLLDPRTGKVLPWGFGSGGEPGLSASIVNCLLRDSDGRIWAGTADSGLFVLEPGGGRFRAVGRRDRRAEGLGSLRVNALLEDSRGRLWVGTSGGGLSALDPRSGGILQRGFPPDFGGEGVYGLAEDRRGVLWAACSRGLFSLDPQRGDLYRFGPEDGLCPGGVSPGAILLSRSGQIWLGSEGGITRFDPERIPRYAPVPDVVLADVRVPAGAKAPLRSQDGSELELGHDNRGLSFAIAVVDFAASGRNSYSMRLEGRQPEWTEMGGVNTGYLAPLAPGRHILRVRAANGNGVWNRYGASLSILVRPPWWGTWWFRAAAGFLLLLLAAGAAAASLASLRRRNALLVRFAQHIEEAREEERTIVARDVHDEIGQHLMVLNFHAYWLATNPEAGREERQSVVEQLRRGILEAMDAVKMVATRLRPAGLDTLDFPDLLRYYVRSFDRMSGVRTSLEVGEGWAGLEAESVRVFFRLLQEMLSNVARHSKAKRAWVRFSADEGGFLLQVEDDGQGIDAAKIEAQDSFGIIGMRESCASRGGSLGFASREGGGCVASARLPRGGKGGPRRAAGGGPRPGRSPRRS